MRKFIEQGKWLFEFQNDKVSFDLILHKGESLIFWFRIGKLGKYFQLDFFGKK